MKKQAQILAAMLGFVVFVGAGCVSGGTKVDPSPVSNTMPVPADGTPVTDTEVNSFMPVPGSNVPEMIVE